MPAVVIDRGANHLHQRINRALGGAASRHQVVFEAAGGRNEARLRKSHNAESANWHAHEISDLGQPGFTAERYKRMRCGPIPYLPLSSCKKRLSRIRRRE